MNRTEKATLVDALHQRLQATSLVVTTEYRGLTVAQINALRRELKTVDARYQVSKNTLTRLALKDTAFACLEEFLTGPIGLVTSGENPVAAAKILVKYAEQYEHLTITGGVMDGAALPAADVSALARLPSREVLLAQVLGVINAPAAQLLRTIQEPGARMARLIGALERSKKEQEAAA